MEISTAVKFFRALVLVGNLFLMMSLSLVFALCKLEFYNPWNGNTVNHCFSFLTVFKNEGKFLEYTSCKSLMNTFETELPYVYEQMDQ